MESGHAPKCPSPRDSWLFLPYVSRAGPNWLTSRHPFHFMKQATNSTRLSKFPDDLHFALFYYPLRNVSVIEIRSRRVLWSCHLAFYFWLAYLCCAFKSQSDRNLPEGLTGLKLRISPFTPRQEVKQRSWWPYLSGSQKEEKGKRWDTSAEIYTACCVLFIYADMAVCFFSPLCSHLSVSSSGFTSASRTPHC